MSPDLTAQIAALGIEPTYSARRYDRAATTDTGRLPAVHSSDARRHRTELLQAPLVIDGEAEVDLL